MPVEVVLNSPCRQSRGVHAHNPPWNGVVSLLGPEYKASMMICAIGDGQRWLRIHLAGGRRHVSRFLDLPYEWCGLHRVPRLGGVKLCKVYHIRLWDIDTSIVDLSLSVGRWWGKSEDILHVFLIIDSGHTQKLLSISQHARMCTVPHTW